MSRISPPVARPIAAFVLWAFACGAWLCVSAAAEDYTVLPRRPDLVRDAETTFLIDFSRDGNPVTFAAGERSLDPAPARDNGAATGPFTVAAGKNFYPQAFTIEMILRVPAGSPAKLATPIAEWQAPENYTALLRLDSLRIYGRQGWAGRDKEFQMAATFTGNGMGILPQGQGKWVHLAVGVDFAAGRGGVMVRDLDGNVLLRNSTFMAQGALVNTTDAADAAARWQSMAKAVAAAAASGQPASLKFGADGVDLRAVRISRGLRTEIVEPQIAPLAENFTTSNNMRHGIPAIGVASWDAKSLDASRVVTERIRRAVGFDVNNAQQFTIDETYVPLKPGDPPVTIKLPDLKIGLSTFTLYGTIDPAGRDKLERVWKPCPIEFEARDAAGNVVAHGRRLAKQGFAPRRLQGFHLHVDRPGDHTVTFRVGTGGRETARLMKVVMTDELEGFPVGPIKTKQTLAAPETAMKRLDSLDQARRDRDNLIWHTLPPLNIHLQVHAQDPAFLAGAQKLGLPRWESASFGDGKTKIEQAGAIGRLDFVNLDTKEIFSQEKILAGEPLPGDCPDDGTGVLYTKADHPELPHDIYATPRANLLGRRVQLFLGVLGTWDYRGMGLPAKYFASGDPQVGHDAALALVRLAYDWPALENSLHEQRLCSRSPDFEHPTDWTRGRNGKLFYAGWSGGQQVDLMTAYDQLFPYIQGNQVFADAVGRFIPWVKTPDDVVALLDRYLVFAGVRDFERGLMRVAPVTDIAATVLGPHPATAKFYDLTSQVTELFPYAGTYQEIYATALNRCGSYHTGSLGYMLGIAESTLAKAAQLAEAKRQGVALKMDLSDVKRFTKVRGASDYLIDMWVAGGFPFMVGDDAGGPHVGLDHGDRILNTHAKGVRHAFDLTGSPRHAWLLANRFGQTSPEIVKAADGQRDPILHARSRVVPDWGAVVEAGSDETDVVKKTAATLRLGTGQGHAHSDYLDLNLFGLGLPMAVDLACRNEGGHTWSRPAASWAFLHNHAIAHDTDDPKVAGGQDGEPWLRAFEPPLVRAGYVDKSGAVRIDREVFLMPMGDDGTHYCLDIQRLTGNANHTWCFHGCESRGIEVNTPMDAKTVRWTDRLLDGTQKAGRAPATLVATWTMTREARDVPHTFNGGGVIKTVAAEQAVLGKRYDAALPPARTRATLLGVEGDAVLEGSPFSQRYAYAFPFLWVQRQAKPGTPTVYPAVYEWYRGDTPVVKKAEFVSREPLVIKVTTTSGQVDTYSLAGDVFGVVSRDAKGVRYAQLNGGTKLDLAGATITAAKAVPEAKITAIDYDKRTITLDTDIDAATYADIGNDGRRAYVPLAGQGRSFTYPDDLLVHEGLVTSLRVTGEDAIALQTNQQIFHVEDGNRKQAGYTVNTEDHAWAFRDGKVIRRPTGAKLSEAVFTDSNGDGRITAKTYEIGVGDTVRLPTNVSVTRSSTGHAITGNVPATFTAGRP
jgi:hypothetical protein